MPRYALSLDSDSITETLDAHAFGLIAPTDALNILAIRAGVRFYNIAVVPSTDTHFFAATTRFAFDSTPDDIAAYCAFYDADLDVIEPLDA